MKTTCPHCAGMGTAILCVSNVKIHDIPSRHQDAIAELKVDAIQCKTDHEKLVKINPTAKNSYDWQLAITLTKLNERADEILA